VVFKPSPLSVEAIMKKSQRAREQESSNDADRPSPAPETAAEPTGHDELGRFVAGNAGGPGNPFARRVAQLRKVMLECVTDKEMEIIVCELVIQAKMGNLAAIKLLFQYILGKPAAVVDPDTLDHQEVDLFRSAPAPGEYLEMIQRRMPPEVMVDLLRASMPTVGRTQCHLLGKMLEDYDSEADEDADDFDDDEEQEGEEVAAMGAERQAAAVGAGAASAPSTNGGMSGGPRPRATRPERNGGPEKARPGAAPGEPRANGKPGPRRDGPTFIDPRERG
jgi:hypothetical protein